MEQRRLRPGDRLDDYCPRERRLTDHVVVAVVDDTVKQTRCVACDTEHPFKDARVPPRRLKKAPAPALVERAVEAPEPDTTIADEAHEADPQPNLVMRPVRKTAKGRRGSTAEPDVPPGVPDATPEPPALAAGPAEEDEGPVHRRLIRATLPRPEGQVPVRPLPEFTIRQPGTRGFPRGNRAGVVGQKPAGQLTGGPWNGRPNGYHGGGRPANPPGSADPRARHRGGRPRPPRHQSKKSR